MRAMLRTTLAVALVTTASSAWAQSLGTFRWQLQPFCNVVTVTVTQVGGVYRLEGTDDQCGAPQPASALGTAFLNPDGSIGLGLAIVTAPGGAIVSVDAAISLSSLSGSWRDGLGHTGTFVFTPGASVPGSPRPPVPAGVPVTTVTVGPGLTSSQSGSTVSLSVTFGGDGVSAEAARADHTHSVRLPTNTAVGDGALNALRTTAGTVPEFNTAVGRYALHRNAGGSQNTAVGASALENNVNGVNNVAVGVAAMLGNVSGSGNTAVGLSALGNGAFPSSNTAVGSSALWSTTAGGGNVAIGDHALWRNTTGSFNIAIGTNAGSDTDQGQSGNIYIGSAGFGPDSYTIRIGNSSHVGAVIGGIAGRTAVGGIPVIINPGGRLGTTTSSARFKDHIEPLPDLRLKLAALRPVQFTYKKEFGGTPEEVQYGLIAEDVARVFPELVVRDDAGTPWAVRYQLLTPLLLAEVQRLEAARRSIDERLRALGTRLEALEAVRSADRRQPQ